MVGIVAYGTYVPKYRLGPETAGWGLPYARAIANFDEDSVTMAAAAAIDCLRGRERAAVDGLLFASATAPYAEKQGAALIAAALDLRRDIFTADFAAGLRAGTAALQAALDAVAAGSANQVLVAVADSRQGAPRSETERNGGDGAAAFLVGKDGVIAARAGAYSRTDTILDNWRSAGDAFVRSAEDRFAAEQGLARLAADGLAGFRERHGLTPGDIAKVALYAPDARRHGQLARQLGFQPEQVQDPLYGQLGNTGAAFAPMLLAAALETAQPGQLLLTIAYGDGCDLLAFRATPAIAAARRDGGGLAGWLNSGRTLDSYETYAQWREVWTTDTAARRPSPATPSAAALWREQDKNLRLYGGQCNDCGYIQYPMQRVCVNCRARDTAIPVRLSDRPGELFTYSLDYLAGAIDTPLVVGAVDFQGGGRIICMLTDREPEEVRVGMPVTMSFRKLRVVNGIHNYYWKAIPRRRPAAASPGQERE